MPGSQWKRIARVGTPKVKLTSSETRPSEIQISFKTKPGHDHEWEKFFRTKSKQLGIYTYFDSSGMDGGGGSVNADEEDLEKVVALLDEAVEHANDQYEKQILARQAEADQRAKGAEIAKQLQADLDERATKLAKPDPDATRIEDYRNLDL
jgi:hypothetical protein